MLGPQSRATADLADSLRSWQPPRSTKIVAETPARHPATALLRPLSIVDTLPLSRATEVYGQRSHKPAAGANCGWIGLPARCLRIHPHGADALPLIGVPVHRATVAGTVHAVAAILAATRFALRTPGAVCGAAVAHACITGAVAVALAMRATTFLAALQRRHSKCVIRHRGQLPRCGGREVRRRNSRSCGVRSCEKRQRKYGKRCSKNQSPHGFPYRRHELPHGARPNSVDRNRRTVNSVLQILASSLLAGQLWHLVDVLLFKRLRTARLLFIDSAWRLRPIFTPPRPARSSAPPAAGRPCPAGTRRSSPRPRGGVRARAGCSPR